MDLRTRRSNNPNRTLTSALLQSEGCLLRAHPCVQLLQQRASLHRCEVEIPDHGNAKAAVRNECAKPGPESLRDLLKYPCLFVELSYCLLKALHLRPPYSKNDPVAPFDVRQSPVQLSPASKDVASALPRVIKVHGYRSALCENEVLSLAPIVACIDEDMNGVALGRQANTKAHDLLLHFALFWYRMIWIDLARFLLYRCDRQWDGGLQRASGSPDRDPLPSQERSVHELFPEV